MIHSFLKFLALFAFFQMVSCSEDDDKAILSQMQDWGEKIFRIIENKYKTSDKGQYLVAALLPDAALDKPMELSKRLLKGCPTNGPDIAGKMIECSTSAVILNKVSEEIWKHSPWKGDKQYKNHPWHGEYMLVNEGIIERLINNFHKENGDNAKCRVYLYSYFIPCADIFGCPYSCSEEVADYNNREKTTCKITVIGYTEVFRRSKTMKTNEVRAENVIRAEMDLYHTVQNVKLLAIKTVRTKNQPVSFQELMYSCLYESPLSGCCVDDTDSRVNSKRVIAYFVNNIVYKAVNDPKFANRRFSDASRKDLDKYFRELFETKDIIHTGCGKCPSEKSNIFLIEFCSKTALDLASGFGSPASPNDLSSATWTAPRDSWKNLYVIPPDRFLNTKKVMCAYRPLSIDSLCTRLTKREWTRSPSLVINSEFNSARRDD
ncbi:uncharacterized protein LOC123551193 [Mercenaria mercenaria]|uniref:uncharacterized protein LOC123551193 n=1 Tax=Mercenaria mercenaria TaxID=6596 RepID=UPI00234E7709|nr:uncharacterized protein LOC123551193 [Mercenaria mercenaria]XP_045195864.2 uncharacterized protein LOC123551193 [Mercenaria mercenaria]XP_045195865.2 uncharacterized protein LOC123551193 [Mercenaria mercenaria]